MECSRICSLLVRLADFDKASWVAKFFCLPRHKPVESFVKLPLEV